MSFVSTCSVLSSRTLGRNLGNGFSTPSRRSCLLQSVPLLILGSLFAGSLFAGHAQVRTHSPQTPKAKTPAPALAGPSGKLLSLPQKAAAANYLRTPLSFEPNRGQAAPNVRFVSHGSGYSLALTDSAAVLTLHHAGSIRNHHGLSRIFDPTRKLRDARHNSVKSEVVRMELAGTTTPRSIRGSDPLGGTTNYFIGKDPGKWQTRVPNYASVRYGAVYPGIDLVYYGNQRRLEYDFIVAPHADPKQVRLHFAGAERLRLDSGGNLRVIAANGEVVFQKPAVYQEKKGHRVPVDGRFALLAGRTVGFKLGGYDRGQPLVIDPTLSYSTYLGGSKDDGGTAIAVDTAGNIYVAGTTDEIDFPTTTGSYRPANPNTSDESQVTFVSKLNPAGSALVYSTYLGGGGDGPEGLEDDEPSGIAVDAAGSAYVAGETFSNDFPVTTGAFQAANNAFAAGGENAFVTKLSADGTMLIYSTYLGGSGIPTGNGGLEAYGDSPLRIAVDGAGSAYVVGTAYSTDFPTTTPAYQKINKAAANQGANAFVAKLAVDGKTLAYSTYIGGSGGNPDVVTGTLLGDEAGGIAVDAAGEAYVSGATNSPDFPVISGGYQQVNHALANGGFNAFVCRLNSTGAALLDSTLLGGQGAATGSDDEIGNDDNGDLAVGVALDPSGNVYLAGASTSPDFPTTSGVYQAANKAIANHGYNAFVSKLDPTLTTLIYSTYIGGSGYVNSDDDGEDSGDFAYGIAVDAAGDAYLAGTTTSPDYPVTGDAFQSGPRNPGIISSAVLTEVNPSGTGLLYSTYLGGSGAALLDEDKFFFGDIGYDLALDASNNAYLTGFTYSYDFPVTKNALQRVNKAGGGPGTNTFITKFGATAGATYIPTTVTLTSTPYVAGTNVTLTALVKGPAGTGVPTGTVDFYANTSDISTGAIPVTLDGTGTAAYTTNQLVGSGYSVIAAYSGDAAFGASGSSILLQNTPVDTPAQLVYSMPPAALIGSGGNGGTVLVNVEDASGNLVTTPSITVTIELAAPTGLTPQTFSTATVNGIATFSFGNTPLTVSGGYLYIATSPGLLSAVAYESVSPVISTIAPASVTVGSGDTALNLTGNFTGLVGSTGDYVCVNGPQGTDALPIAGSNTAIAATIPARFFATAASLQVYIGDIYCGVRLSNSVPLRVASVLTPATATLAITPASVAYGKPVTLAAAVSTAGGPVSPGEVVFCLAGAAICNAQDNLGSAQLNAAGIASLPLGPGAVGVHTYAAVFVGNAGTAIAVSQPVSVTVTGTYPTTTTLAATGNPSGYTLASTVVGFGVTALTPGGSVSVFDQTNNNALLGAAPLGAGTPAQTFAAAAGSPLTAGPRPYAVATGDFNGDGFTDFAVENYNGDRVSVFLGNGNGAFQAQVTYPVGALPEGIAAADLNGDGKLDLVVTNTGGNTVGVLLGNGDGTFQTQVVYGAGAEDAGLVVVDLNHDGKLDIATSNYAGANISILLGNGDGTFQTQVTYPVGNTPRTLAFGDFNGDGNIDLAVANQSDGAIGIVIGNGDGTFQPQVIYPAGASPQGVAVADFNGDGKADLAVGGSGVNSVQILIGNGDGTFQAVTSYLAGNTPLGVVAADFNGDGKTDIAVENFGDGTESILLGNGNGTFQAQTVFPAGTNPYAAAVGDFNDDGNPDLVISNFGGGTETVLLDQLTSTATAVLPPVALTGAAGNHNVVSTYPGNTYFSTSTSPAISLMTTGTATTTLALTASPAFSSPGQPVTLTATLAPYNGTGFTSDGETVTFLNGGTSIGTGTLVNGIATLTTRALPAGANSLTASYPGDANLAASVSAPLSYDVTGAAATATTLAVTAAGTAVTTVVSGTAVALTATVTFNGAPVTPGAVLFCDASAAICENSAILGAAQLTAAGTASLILVPAIGSHSYKAVFAGTVSNAASTSAAQPLTVTGLFATTTALAASGSPGGYTLASTVVGVGSTGLTPAGAVNFVDTTDGNASLGAAPLGTATPGLGFLNPANPAAPGNPTAIVTGDWNGDGKPDLAIGSLFGATITILLGNGDGTYTSIAGPTVAAGSYEMTAGDFNSDGKTDLAVVNERQSTVAILLSNGDGTFAAGNGLELQGSPGGIVTGDFNGDGKLDLAVTAAALNSLEIFLGNGDGSFTPSSNADTGNNPSPLAVGDWNGDGLADLAVANAIGNSITVYLSNGDGTLNTVGTVATGNDPQAIATGDFNGDGKLDLAVANHDDATVSILLGDGTGNFTAKSLPATGPQPFGIALADFNGDGILDLATANYLGTTASVLLGVGDGTFHAASTVTVGSAPQAIVAGDWNGDGVPDLATANAGGNTASVLLTQRTQTATATLPNVAVAGAAGNHLVVATYPGNTNFAASASTPVTLVPAALSTPAITSLTPSSAYVGSEDTTVTITGTNFLTGAAVTVNGTSQAATFVSATQLSTTVTAAQQANVGTLNLVVVNPDGGTSNAAVFTVLQLPLQLAPANLAFGNQTVGTPSAPQVVTVANSTAAPIAITTILLDLGLNPGDFSQTNNCPATLAAAANCKITVIFTPGGVGPKSAGLLIADNPSLPQESVGLTGTGTGGILQVNPGNLKTIAGNGTAGYAGDSGPAPAAELNDPDGVNFDAQGNLYIADVVNNVIRKVDASGNITTVAGNGTAGFSGDGGPAAAAELHGPFGVVPDAAGNLYIQDTLNARIRKVNAATGIITTIAGNGAFGLTGDGGPAAAAEVSEVQGSRFDAAGNLYVAQCGPAAIRKIDTAGNITTVAGTGTDGFSGDGGPATGAQLNCASGVAIDAAGELFIADYLNDRIRKVDATGVITTIAGTGAPGFTGDGGPAAAAEINLPNDVEVDAAGNVYIADSGNNRIRRIDPAGVITTVVGGLDNAGSAGVNAPSGIALDAAGSLYFSDAGNNAVREVFPAGALAFPATAIGAPAANQTVTLSNIGNVPVTIASQASFGLTGDTTDFSLAGGSCLAGATLAANGGSCALQIGFTPTAAGTRTLTVSIADDAVYSPQTFSIGGTGVTALPVVLDAITPAGALAGASDTTITAAGANFTATSVVNFNGAPLVTTFVSATQLTAVVPAALITTAGTANITITDPLSDSTSAPQLFTILPGTPGVVTFSAPPTAPGEQPTLNFGITQPYPVAITGTMTLAFAPDTGNPDNPQVQLASTTAGVTLSPDGRTLTFPLAANSTATPVVMVQVGNVSGTITVTLQLTAAGVNVTPATVAPVAIVVPRVAPTITSLSFSASGNTLTVLVAGFSTTREIQSATFNFTPASGASLNQKTLTVPAAGLFTTWYTTAASAQFGSAFTYTQLFTLSGNATVVAGVGATLTNSVGTSTEAAAP